MKQSIVVLMTLHLLIGSTRAELIFQPPYSNSTTKWQEAGSSLFGGIARIYDGFAALERRKEDDASQHLQSALADLKRAAEIYSELAGSIKKGQTISLGQLPEPVKTQIQNDLRRYDVTVPSNEHEAALVASNEVRRLSGLLADLSSRIIEKKDLNAIQNLVSALTKAQVIGTDIALAMQIPLPSPTP